MYLLHFLHRDLPKQDRGGLEGLVLKVVGLMAEKGFCRRQEHNTQQCGFGPRVHPARDICFDSCQQWISEEQDKHVGLLPRTLSKPPTS